MCVWSGTMQCLHTANNIGHISNSSSSNILHMNMAHAAFIGG